MRQQLQNASIATTDTSCESVVTTPQQPLKDANKPAGLLSIAEETLAEFLAKATGTAVDWVQMPGMKLSNHGSLEHSTVKVLVERSIDLRSQGLGNNSSDYVKMAGSLKKEYGVPVLIGYSRNAPPKDYSEPKKSIQMFDAFSSISILVSLLGNGILPEIQCC